MSVCVCVCVRERERERVREKIPGCKTCALVCNDDSDDNDVDVDIDPKLNPDNKFATFCFKLNAGEKKCFDRMMKED